MNDDERLLGALSQALAPSPAEPSDAQYRALRRAVERTFGAPRPRPFWQRRAAVLLAAAALGTGTVVAALDARDRDRERSVSEDRQARVDGLGERDPRAIPDERGAVLAEALALSAKLDPKRPVLPVAAKTVAGAPPVPPPPRPPPPPPPVCDEDLYEEPSPDAEPAAERAREQAEAAAERARERAERDRERAEREAEIAQEKAEKALEKHLDRMQEKLDEVQEKLDEAQEKLDGARRDTAPHDRCDRQEGPPSRVVRPEPDDDDE